MCQNLCCDGFLLKKSQGLEFIRARFESLVHLSINPALVVIGPFFAEVILDTLLKLIFLVHREALLVESVLLGLNYTSRRKVLPKLPHFELDTIFLLLLKSHF